MFVHIVHHVPELLGRQMIVPWTELGRGGLSSRCKTSVGAIILLVSLSILMQLKNLRTAITFPKQSSVLSRIVELWHDRLIYDVSLPWYSTVDRLWLEDNTTSPSKNPPSTMILMTSYGWNGPNQTEGLLYARSIRERELYTGLVNHPLFHPTAWNDIENKVIDIPNNTNYYVFLDRMSCTEGNYPIYGGGITQNKDYEFGRTPDKESWEGFVACSANHLGLETTRLFQAVKEKDKNHLNINASLMLFNCKGWGDCKQDGKNADPPTSIAYLSGTLQKVNEDFDQGLIPPPGKRTILTLEEEESIQSCKADTEREFNVVYIGNFRSGRNSDFHERHGGARHSYLEHHNTTQKIIVQNANDPKPTGLSYTDMMRSTKFALVPRGDNKFSYRFSEALSAGAIPVYHGDNYMLPFRPELISWEKCAILLPEKDAGDVGMEHMQLLLSQPDKMCSMRKYCYFEIYKKYIETDVGIIDGLVKGLDLVAQGNTAKFQGFKCNHTEDLGCNNLRR
mmetsp:Transcript_23628/g.33738  ORF Transcript_23628/g.33738 Transcript_23628/m.33738 type:complete len:508 (+) Transcript_23628:735-2258(+)